MISLSRSVRVAGALVAVLALGGTLLLAGPRVLAELGGSVIGLGGDPYQTLWRFDGLAKALARGSLTVTGEPFRNFGPLPWLPLHLLFGEPNAYNLVWILQGPLTALATYALGRTLGLQSFPAGIAGILAAFAPYRLAQSLGHFGAMQVFWVPATLAVFLSWLRKPTVSVTLFLAFLLIGTAWTEHTLFLTTLVAIAVAGVFFFNRVRAFCTRPKATLLVGILLLLIVAGAVLPFRSELAETSKPTSRLNLGHEQRLRFAPTFKSLFSLAPFQVFSDTLEPYGTSAQTVADQVHSLGALAVILAGVSVWGPGEMRTRRRSALFLAGLIILGIGLAVASRVWLLAPIFERLPIVSALRAVNRFLVLPSFALPLLAAGTLRAWPKIISVLLAGLLLLEVLPKQPFPAQPAVIPAFYAQLALERPGRLLEVPGVTDYLVASKALYASVVHGREIAGSIAFERVDNPREREALLRVPFLSDVLLLRPTALERPTFFAQKQADIAHAALASEDIAVIVLHGSTEGRPVLRFGADGPKTASLDDISGVRKALREAGFLEERVGYEVFLYRIPAWPRTRSAAVVLQGPGWERANRSPDGTIRAALTKETQFEIRVLGEKPIPLVLRFRIPDGSASGDIRLTSPSGESQIKSVRPGESVHWTLGLTSPGRHSYQLGVDERGIIVENPSFRQDP